MSKQIKESKHVRKQTKEDIEFDIKGYEEALKDTRKSLKDVQRWYKRFILNEEWYLDELIKLRKDLKNLKQQAT
jgi:hypothetical protein